MGSRLYGIKGRRKKLIGRDRTVSPRMHAKLITAWSNDGSRHYRKGWQPKRRRRKLGARRTTTLLKTIFRWIKVPVAVRKRRR